MARTDSLWEDINGGTAIKTIAPLGYDILINGLNKYLNFNTDVGSSGYGFRDNSGVMQFKNSAGAWAAFGTGSGDLTKSQADTYYYPLSTNPANYLVAADLSGYATETWVGLQGFVTGTPWTLEGYITNILGQDLSTADNTTSAFITLVDIPAGLWTESAGTLFPTTTTDRILLGGAADDTISALQVNGNSTLVGGMVNIIDRGDGSSFSLFSTPDQLGEAVNFYSTYTYGVGFQAFNLNTGTFYDFRQVAHSFNWYAENYGENAMVLTDTGHLLINTTTDDTTSALQVNGNTTISGTLGAGAITGTSLTDGTLTIDDGNITGGLAATFSGTGTFDGVQTTGSVATDVTTWGGTHFNKSLLGSLTGSSGWAGNGFAFENTATGTKVFGLIYNVDTAWFGSATDGSTWFTASNDYTYSGYAQGTLAANELIANSHALIGGSTFPASVPVWDTTSALQVNGDTSISGTLGAGAAGSVGATLLGRTLLGGATDDGTSALQVNGDIKDADGTGATGLILYDATLSQYVRYQSVGGVLVGTPI